MTAGCTTTALAYGGKGANAALCHGATAVSHGTLPFTGVDLIIVAGAGLACIALGLVLAVFGK